MTSEEKMREEFEAFYGETEGVYFIQGLNVYGCELYKDKEQADRKSDAWYYWKASRESLVIELPEAMECDDGYPTDDWLESNAQKRMLNICRESIHAAGVKTK